MKGCYFTTGFFLLLRLIYFCHSIIFLQYLSNILNSTTEKFTDNSHILSIQSDDFLNKFTQMCNFHHNPVLKYLCHPKHFLKSLCSQPQLQLPTQGKQRFFFFFLPCPWLVEVPGPMIKRVPQQLPELLQ